MKRSNPEMLHIYEPLMPEWLEQKDDKKSYLHNLPIWEDYHRPEFKQIEDEWVKVDKDMSEISFQKNVEEVAPLFNLLHKHDIINIIIQPNRCHLILNDINIKYKFIYIIEDLINTIKKYLISLVD